MAAAAAAVLLALAPWGCEPRRASSAQTTPAQIPRLVRQNGQPDVMVLNPGQVPGMTLVTVRKLDLAAGLEANGQVTFDDRRVASIVSRVSGRIEEVRVSQWDYVRKGELILSLYSPDFMTAEAEYLQARATEHLSGGAPGVAAGNGGDIGAALVSAARRKLELLGMADADIRALKGPSPTVWMRAPIAGTVVENKAVRGAAVSPGDVLYSLGTLNEVWITASIYEDDLARVHVGQQLEAVTTAFPNTVFKGRIARISPDISATTHTAQIRCEVRNPGDRLKPQMLARVRIITRPGAALVVPQSALVFDTDSYFAFVVTGGNRITRRKVEVASWSAKGYVRVVSGLASGERVVNDESLQVNALWHEVHGEGS
jgi:membrane fusion protein, copper/silver efflux system